MKQKVLIVTKKQLNSDNSIILSSIGWCYQYGKGTEKNEAEAFNCYKKAVEIDSSDSTILLNIGYCYLRGIGTEVDKLKAKELLSKALEIDPDCEEIKTLLKECDE